MSIRFPRRIVIFTLAVVLALSVLGFMIYGLVELVRPKSVSEFPPQYFFRELVCDPVPSSVTNLVTSGSIMFTGHSVTIYCKLAPNDFESLLKTGNFTPVESSQIPTNWIETQLEGIPASEFYQKHGGEFDDRRKVYLLATTNHDRIYVRYWRG
jgi:hypothetical protein